MIAGVALALGLLCSPTATANGVDTVLATDLPGASPETTFTPIHANPIPEPGALLLFATGMIVLFQRRNQRTRGDATKR